MLIQFHPTLNFTRLGVASARRKVELEVAPEGLIAAILRMLGLGGHSRLVVDSTGVRLREIRFSGQTQTFSPLANIAASVSTSSKPTGLLVAASSLGLIAFPQLIQEETFVFAIVLLIVSAIFCVAYFLSKQRVTIGVVTNAADWDA